MLASLGFLVSYFTRNTIMGFYYAVAKGRKPGIYNTWDECKAQVYKFSGPIYKKFSSSDEAQEFIDSRSAFSNANHSLSNGNFVHARAPRADHLIALGKQSGSENRTKRTRNSEVTSENDGSNVRKRLKGVSSGKDTSSDDPKNHGSEFNMDPDGFVNVYTDGACSGNGYRGAKAGVGVYFGENSPLNISAPVVGRATNNMAEIQAVTRAAEVALGAGMTKLRVHTDSEFLIKCITQWMSGWKKRGWKTASGTPVANKAELLQMETALKPFRVEWNHVRGHQGIHGNEMADKLARQGAEKYKRQ